MSEVALRDGSRVIVRPVQADGKQRLLEGFERFGEQSRYRRFMGIKKRLSDEELAFFTEIDHHDHEALVAVDPESDLGVGVARFIRLSGDAAEAAVAIVDEWQGRGLGGLLLSRLAARAREEGVDRFRAWMLGESRDMLHLFERLGEVRVLAREGDSVEIEVPLSSPSGAR
jgi:GNAT superfamily N-acetyltransferase